MNTTTHQPIALHIPRTLILIVCLGLMLGMIQTSHALEVPHLTERIMDQAHVLSPSTHHHLSQLLETHEHQTTQQIAILTIPSLADESIEDFSHRVASTWKLGVAGRDNGILILLAVKSGRIRIEVGYGLEGTLTDARSRQILDRDFLPSLQQGQFNEGMTRGITALLAALTPPDTAHAEPDTSETSHSGVSTTQAFNTTMGVVLLLLLAFIVIGGLVYDYYDHNPDTEFSATRAAGASIAAASFAMSAAPRRSTGRRNRPTTRIDPWERAPVTARHASSEDSPTNPFDLLNRSSVLPEDTTYSTSESFTGHGGEFGGGGASAVFNDDTTTTLPDTPSSDN